MFVTEKDYLVYTALRMGDIRDHVMRNDQISRTHEVSDVIRFGFQLEIPVFL